jgi:hypothetical protein
MFQGTMHEIFLTTSIGDEYCAKATRILQGYCGMSPTPILRRRLILKGPSNRGDYRSIQPQFMLNQQQKTRLWQSLNEQLTRQGYCIALLYDIKKDDFPKVGEELEVEEKR